MAPEAASIHLTNRKKKIQGGLGLSRDNLLDGLVPGVFSTIFLVDLGADG